MLPPLHDGARVRSMCIHRRCRAEVGRISVACITTRPLVCSLSALQSTAMSRRRRGFVRWIDINTTSVASTMARGWSMRLIDSEISMSARHETKQRAATDRTRFRPAHAPSVRPHTTLSCTAARSYSAERETRSIRPARDAAGECARPVVVVRCSKSTAAWADSVRLLLRVQANSTSPVS
jgi:hypothetical protein